MKLLAIEPKVARRLLENLRGKPKGFFFFDPPADEPLQARIKDRTAIIPIKGVITEESLWFGESVKPSEIRDVVETQALNDAIDTIVLDIDSPGGELPEEAAQAIFEARSLKKVVAYTPGLCCSAAYWLASAAHNIVANNAALVGSVGVILSVWRQGDSNWVVDIVSSQSPNKIPNVDQPDDRARIQQQADDLAEVMIEAIASYRGVTPDIVKQNFGKGDVMIAGKGMAAGMVDHIGNFKTALSISTVPAPTESEPAGQTEPAKGEGGQSTEANTGAGSAGENKTMKKKLFAKVKKTRAELVIVDTEDADVEGVPVEEINREWLEANMPELVDEIKEVGAEEERTRLEDIDEVDVEEGDEKEAEMVAAARANRKVTGQVLSFDIMKHRKAKAGQAKTERSNEAPAPLATASAAGATEAQETDKKVKSLADYATKSLGY